MRVAIITGKSPHHRNLCVEIARRRDVVAIFNPLQRSPSRPKQFRRMLKSAWRKEGRLYAVPYLAGRIGGFLADRSLRESYGKAEREFFPDAEAEFAKIDPGIVHEEIAINSEAAIRLLGEVSPDVVICLGGPIYKAPLIDSCKLMLNFHSGISPIYNGTRAIDFAFANGHAHLCGGTLMTMSTAVDGGEILGHYLPPLQPGDIPASLFMKTALGAAVLYDRFLSHLARSGAFAAVKQPRPLFYYKGADWSASQSQAMGRFIRKQQASDRVRPEEVAEYWAFDDCVRAREALQARLVDWLWGA